ncbi:MAG: hypothetical protein H6559_29120 [Lewinellaceae bacterium]|nr:hypothetical protein [Lewinellaceae bacterium]
MRDWAVYETTLSGDIDNDGTLANNSYHVIFNNNLNNTAVLDGFTVSGGNADGAEPITSAEGCTTTIAPLWW